MSIATQSITVVITCDTSRCDAQTTITAASVAAAKAKASGWWFGRRYGGQRVECPACHRRFTRQVRAGILSCDGRIIDMARWEVEYDSWIKQV